MSRTRARALALVNWRGVFYERYLLDRHVTALEGANGAGKTTVMIAAYVALLPDMSRLRFTNLGESGATAGDKGIWGRLGHPERPSYTALELTLPDGERLVMGVHLERKAEPSVEPTPFIVTHLPNGSRLQDLLLRSAGEFDEVPRLTEVQDSAKRLGARIEVFQSAKDYFAALFERGVTPLRLASDDDRNRLNELLRTSMTGGISRALTSDLRSFLLKQETGLTDTLSRMRMNLEACRKTRLEVAASRKLEHEINGIHAAGQAMFSAALIATRARHDEALEEVEAARQQWQQAETQVREAEAAARQVAGRRDALLARLQEVQRALEQARSRVEASRRASELARALAELRTELELAERASSASAGEQRRCSEERRRGREARDLASADYARAAQGLADLQRGLEEIHRRAHAFRAARAKLEQVRELLGEPDFEADAATLALEAQRAELGRLDAERARLDREARGAEVARREYAEALDALLQIDPEVDRSAPQEAARSALARLATAEAAVASLPELSRALERAEHLAERQAAVRSRAESLGVDPSAEFSVSGLEQRLQALEDEWRRSEARARELSAEAQEHAREARALRERRPLLEARLARRRALSELVARIGEAFALDDTSSAALLQLRARLLQEQASCRARVLELEQRRTAGMRELAALEAGARALDPELLRLRDELGAELLLERFEEAPIERAASLEAELGALTHALVVEDPEAAARTLAGQPRALASVWLLDPSAAKACERAGAGRAIDGDLVLPEAGRVRITRIPEQPTLGRVARQRRAEDVAAALTACEVELEQCQAHARRLDEGLLDLARALADVEPSGDPGLELEALITAIDERATAERGAREAAAESLEQASAARARTDALRALLVEAHLLEGPDQRERARELAERVRELEGARAELERTASARRVLARLVQVLRSEPAELTAQAALAGRLDEQRDRVFLSVQALEELLTHRHALGFADAVDGAEDRRALMPALEAQLAAAKQRVAETEAALGEAEGAWEQAVAAHQQAESVRLAVAAQVERSQAELAELGSSHQGPDASEHAAAEARELEHALGRARDEERQRTADAAVLEERAAQLRQRCDAGAADLSRAEARCQPLAAQWEALRDAAATERIFDAALASDSAQALLGRSSLSCFAEARSHLAVLCDRLAAANAEDAASALREQQARAEGAAAEAYLAAWLTAREWLLRRLPSQVMEGDDPLLGLERLRQHLSTLEERLVRQEMDLRGASEDVARSIDVQLRRAAAQVRRLNQHLADVQFGSIRGIRVQLQRVARMDQVLQALRAGSAQDLLFHPGLPIEEALNEIFRRFGGGRTGGQRLLDYREYLELTVEVQRRSSGEWEPANASRLSTGEAIGVGAALMMVVLTEWERDANLLRAKRAGGSLRFLFLDEANRLSQDNLGVLFELCQGLDLQLLIAAPEVARSEGNTTYRLVRRVTDSGEEEVVVSGRRTARPDSEDDPETAPPEAPNDSAQLSLEGSGWTGG